MRSSIVRHYGTGKGMRAARAIDAIRHARTASWRTFGAALALLALAGTACAADGAATAAAEAPRQGLRYTWDSVAIGGGGFVTAVIPSRAAAGVAYARTDVGGAYRWDPQAARWIPLLDWVAEDQTGYLGIDALALDPRDANTVYLLAGIKYLNGGRTAVLRSHDAGKTFDIVDVSRQLTTHGNGIGRQNGERLAVDPADGKRLYLGSRRDGLFASLDAGRSWQRVAGLPVTATPNDVGINLVLPDPASVEGGRARRVFAGVSRFDSVGPNLYRSDDGGTTFRGVTGGPSGLMPQRAALDGAGNLLVTYADGAGPHPDREGREPMTRGAVWKYRIADGAWTDITPHGWRTPFAGISVDPADPRHLVVSTINTFLVQGDAKGDRIFTTRDGGKTWQDVIGRGFAKDAAGVPWLKGHGIHWTGSVAFDPFDPRAVWVTSGNGVFRSADVDAAPATWTFTVAGMEETVPLGLVSIPGGPLVSALGDIDGYLHDDPRRPGRIHAPQMGTTTGLDVAARSPRTLVRLGDSMYLTRDGGATWKKTAALKARRGVVALSADGAVLLHLPERASTAWRSTDDGATWTQVKGLARAGLRPAADPVDPQAFYAYDPDTGSVLASADGGASFAPRASLPAGGAPLVRLAPGREGALWVALKEGGLAHSADGGRRFAMLAGVTQCGAIGFGKAAPGSDTAAIYIWGTVRGVRGLHRSLDGGAHWDRINDDAHQYGGPGDGQFVVGDMNRFGVVYMSTAGRGIAYGTPATP
jgi:photosystem II stability/assembly factor-like uncharacterized protein